MADAVEELVLDDVLRKEMAERGATFASEHFDTGRVSAGIARWILSGTP